MNKRSRQTTRTIMSKQKKKDPELAKLAKGLEEAYRKMIIFKRQKNSPVVVSVGGGVKEIDPYDMPDTTTFHRNADH